MATPEHTRQHSSLTDTPIFFVNAENVAELIVLISQQPLCFLRKTHQL